MNKVNITISGPVGSGKSALYAELVVALTALGLPIEHQDLKAWNAEMNSGAFTEAQNMLEMYKPTVVLSETVDTAMVLKQQLLGRAQFLRDKGEIKTPELLERAAAAL